jgi:hypothetical protein
MTTADIAKARELAAFYKLRGFQPLPSSPVEKRPLCRYAEWWETTAPDNLFDRFETSNIQVMTGRHWRLLVFDLDGPAASEHWETLGRSPRTWVTQSGGGGRHLWFRLPAGYPHKLPKAFVWKGEGEHSAIERLCDQSLVMAPPSIHPKTGNRYVFADRANSPFGLPMPADCPDWVLRLRPLVTRKAPELVAQRPSYRPRVSAPLSADPVTLARSWGVRFTGRVNGRGWAECHAIDREDSRPSAAVHVDSGAYVDLGSGLKLSLAGLGVTLHQFHDIRDALSQLQPSGGALVGHIRLAR